MLPGKRVPTLLLSGHICRNGIISITGAGSFGWYFYFAAWDADAF